MFSPFHSHSQRRAFAIAFVLCVAFLFISEYSYEIRIAIGGFRFFKWYIPEWHIRILDPFGLYSIEIFHHTLAAYCFAISDAPLIIISTWIAAKGLHEVGVIKYFASLIIDWCITGMCYAFRNPSDFDETETTIVFIAIGITIIKLLLYKYVPRFRRIKLS